MKVELIDDVDCPHADAARAALRQALDRVGRSPRWVEWDRKDPKAPARPGLRFADSAR
ncbi:MAG: hypothetical protein Q9Q13_09890 [Acidobacteriota bacterium]|nr:hypothetical protein [Acidobacteriota bacterium]